MHLEHPFARDATYFRYWIAQLWFVHYSRARGRADTSGFEHIFIGEVGPGKLNLTEFAFHTSTTTKMGVLRRRMMRSLVCTIGCGSTCSRGTRPKISITKDLWSNAG